MGNKFVFRPLLYFKELDVVLTVVLTTPWVIHLRRSQNAIDVLGLITMFTFLHLHWKKIVKFQTDARVLSFPMSGWQSALQQGKHGYHTSKLTVVGIKNKFPHAGSKPFIHQSSSSEDIESSDGEDRETTYLRRATKRSHPSPGRTNTCPTSEQDNYCICVHVYCTNAHLHFSFAIYMYIHCTTKNLI